MSDNFYNSGYSGDGYLVKSKGQGDCAVATFICESDANDYCKYRNWYLEYYNTTDVYVYEHK